MKINNKIPTQKQVKSDPEAFLESGSETRMLSILLLWTPSLKYCSKLKGEYKNSKICSGTSVEPSLSPHSLSLKKILVTLSLFYHTWLLQLFLAKVSLVFTYF